jgi:hypothetical protein
MTATIPFGAGLGITFATPIEGQKVHWRIEASLVKL